MAAGLLLIAFSPTAQGTAIPCSGSTMDPVAYCTTELFIKDHSGAKTGVTVSIVGKISACLDGYCTPKIPSCLSAKATVFDQDVFEDRVPCGLI